MGVPSKLNNVSLIVQPAHKLRLLSVARCFDLEMTSIFDFRLSTFVVLTKIEGRISNVEYVSLERR